MLTFDPNSVDLPRGSFVDGNFRPGGGDEIAFRRPSDGRIVGSFREDSPEQVDDAVRRCEEVRKASGWSSADPRRRGAVLRAWATLIEQNLDALAKIEALGSSRPIAEARGRDIPVVAEMLRFFGECADKSYGEVLATPATSLNLTEHEPWGVVLAISPWNVPALLAIAKVAPALAAGNGVILKPSELAPLSMLRIAELGGEAGLPPGLFNVLIGRGSVTGAAAVRHPLVKYVSFTGSNATGAAIMCDAARHGMKPISLELGGKSPQVVFSDSPDLDKVTGIVAAGIARNAGQICFAGSRLIVEQSIAARFVDMVAGRLTGLLAGPTWQGDTELPPIISAAQADRIEALIANGLAGGATLAAGGARYEAGGGHYVQPTILTDLDADNPALREEIFGPVLGVQTFADFDEAIALADHPVYGLAASVHISNIDKALHAARRIDAGTVWINGHGRGSDLSSPFGGFKQSGFGKDFGVSSFEKYHRTKSINIFLNQPA